MPAGTAQNTPQLQLEALNKTIRRLINMESKLDSRISERGTVTKVSLRSFRVRFKTALPGNVAMFNLDGGTIPAGGLSQWDQGTVTPLAWIISVQYSRLSDIIGSSGPTVATENPVDTTLTDVAQQMAINRDQFLQTSGDGHIATVDSTYAGGGANPIVLANNPAGESEAGGAFGARLCNPQQLVQVMSSTYALRGTCTIQTVANKLGGVQQITVDAVPAGTVAGDFIMVAGVAAGTPNFVFGIPYFHNTATSGTYLGISRANPYVVANGVNANGAQITLPALRAAMNRVVQSLGSDALAAQFWHTHTSQEQAYEEMGFAKQQITMSDGKMPGFDGLTRKGTGLTVGGREILATNHADVTRWDFMDPGAWLKVVWGNTPQWFKNKSGQWVFQVMDPSSGMPTADEVCAYYDARQYAVDNPQAISSVTNCKIPVFN
jgi:hypothetical protein